MERFEWDEDDGNFSDMSITQASFLPLLKHIKSVYWPFPSLNIQLII